MPKTIELWAEDTEPLEVTVSAAGVSTLDNVSSVAWYFTDEGGTAHVDGAAGTVSDSANMKIQLDPVNAKSGGGNAFDAAGTYEGYAKLTWSDGDITRHPNGSSLFVVVNANQE